MPGIGRQMISWSYVFTKYYFGGRYMGYKSAVDVLPSELIVQIQKYVDGESIYIPRMTGKERKWGESTDTRFVLDLRNKEICDKYRNGVRVQQLAEEYHISAQGIYKILSKSKV